MNVPFGPEAAARLAQKAAYVQMAGRDLALFGETEPYLIQSTGLEVSALEARILLSGGAPARVADAAVRAVRSGTPVAVDAADLEAVARLEGILTVAAARLGQAIAAIDAQKQGSGMETLGTAIGLATGAIGLIKSLF
jgi:hypothetical protein